jgi:hypothetical protein
MAVLFTNNASSTLAAELELGDTTLILGNGTGELFPSPSPSDLFYLTIEDVSGNFEICTCTGRSADILTINRGQDGTEAQAFVIGSRVELRLTAAALEQFLQTAALQGIVMSAGSGLTGGGAISGSRVFNVGAGVGISVTDDAVALDVDHPRNTDHSNVSVLAGQGLSGGGTLVNSRTLNLSFETLAVMDVEELTPTARIVVDDAGVMKSMAHAAMGVPIVPASTKTLALADGSTFQRNSGSSTFVYTIPTYAAVEFPIGAQIHFGTESTGRITIAPSVGVTLVSLQNHRAIKPNGGGGTLTKVAVNVWRLDGALEVL